MMKHTATQPSIALAALACCTLIFVQACACRPSSPPVYESTEDYLLARENLVERERRLKFSAGVKLSPAEATASRFLEQLRKGELGRVGRIPLPAQNFLRAKELIDESPLMEVFRRMPKGAILHAHPGAIQDLHWLIGRATYLPNCYLYTGPDTDNVVGGAFGFFRSPPNEFWKPVKELRDASTDPRSFDEQLYRSITLGPEDLSRPDMWIEFERCWSRVYGLQRFESVYREFYLRELQAAAAENVQVLELRAFLGGPSGLDEKSKGAEAALALYREMVKEVRKTHPDFSLKIIFSRERAAAPETVGRYLDQALQLRKLHPDLVCGFDLVSEEDRSHALIDFIGEFLRVQHEAHAAGVTLPFFFHAGESIRADNQNLYEAFLLGSRRIGHGIALCKHPLLLEQARELGVAIEVCPISNQVLGYIADLRTHPAVSWLRSGIPVVLSPDDPGMMGGTFSHDYYEAFIAWGLDLADLKQLAMNSLNYSALNSNEKAIAMKIWSAKWQDFIDWLNHHAEVRP